MRGALRAGNLPLDLATALERRVVRALDMIDNEAKPALTNAVKTIRVYRDGVAQPIIERQNFDLADLNVRILAANRNYRLDEDGVIRNRQNDARVGYLEVLAGDADITRDVTTRLLDMLNDARGQSG